MDDSLDDIGLDDGAPALTTSGRDRPKLIAIGRCAYHASRTSDEVQLLQAYVDSKLTHNNLFGTGAKQ
jgi:hypothetical protein